MHHLFQIPVNPSQFSFFEHSSLHFSSLASIFFNSNNLSLRSQWASSHRKYRTYLYPAKITKNIISWSEMGFSAKDPYKISLFLIPGHSVVHGPPQSTPISPWFFIPSLQLAGKNLSKIFKNKTIKCLNSYSNSAVNTNQAFYIPCIFLNSFPFKRSDLPSQELYRTHFFSLLHK